MAPDCRNRQWALLVVALTLLAFFIHLLRLDVQSLWYDEGVTAAIAQRGLSDLTRWTANDIQPPLYYYGVAGWGQLAGWSEWSLRFPSACFGSLAVPLMAALALRLRAGRSAALLAALLTTLHPLFTYYSQEARMYALLVALGVLAGYLLVRAGDATRPAWHLWAAYSLVATAAVYTHYFAFFLLLGLALAFLFDRDARRPRTSLLPFVVANVAVLVLYVPWFTALFTRLHVDRSYWTGALKLHEALLHVAVSMTSGETVEETLAGWLLVIYAAITGWALFRLWQRRAAGRRLLIYALLWLIVPVAAVLALATAIPKFNPRYVMIALPGLLLLWAGGAGAEPRLREQGRPARYILSAQDIANVAVLLLAIGFLFADANWFANPAFTKDEWRQVVEFLRPRLKEDEQVVLVSGHAWPVWQYYAPDLVPVRLPAIDILDVDAVLDFEQTGPALEAAFSEASGKQGAWLVNWQEEVVDPNAVVPVQLELGGREKGQSVPFYGLTLRRYSNLRPGRFADVPPVDHLLDANFGDKVILRGYKVLNNGDLLLFWEQVPGADGRPDDLHFSLHTTTLDGAPIAQPADRRLAGYTYPTFRWGIGEVVMGHVLAQDWLGTTPQPGTVRFEVRVYDAGDPAATPLRLPGGAERLEVTPVEVVID